MSEVSGSINSSLAGSIMEQGVSQRLVVELANIYAWTIDFYGLRKGDQYKILYENRYIEDEYIGIGRSEEHTSELQSRGHLVCRLLLEKKNLVTMLFS